MRFDRDRPIPTRGILIIDGSSLIPLCVPLAEQFLTAESKEAGKPISARLALELLSRNGYEIIIPEMASLVAGDIMRNGDSLARYLNVGNLKKTSEITGLVASFLADIPESDGTIYIASPSDKDQSSSAAYVRNIWHIHRANYKDLIKKDEIVSVRQMERGDWPHEAAQQVIKFMPRPAVPVFYLSENKAALAKIGTVRSDIQVHGICFTNFMRAMWQTNLLTSIGVGPVAIQEVFAHVFSKFFGPRSSGHATRGSIPVFCRTLPGIEVQPKKPDAEGRGDSAETVSHRPVAIDRFNKKWGALGSVKLATLRLAQ